MTAAGRASLPIAVAALLAAVSGCAEQQPCAGVGVVPGVVVYVEPAGYDGLSGATAELCVDGECVRHPVGAEGITKVSSDLPDGVDPDRVTVRLRVTRAGATAPFVDDTVDKKLSFQSDECGGGARRGGLAFTKEDGLTPAVPKKVGEAWMRQIRAEATAPPDPSLSP
ncbi:hypothetical protein [Streptomyces sp. enrichment culture]|uniref:hypothetical protein n=1 Tax=Streptomyces sp. enrichment culture TaxID=1795815 RepID=UPI003F5788AA